MYRLLRPLLFRAPPEAAHRLATTALDLAAAAPGDLLGRLLRPRGRAVRLFGLDFPNPVGIAAGFDKDGRHVAGLAALGFGFVEVGSVTARPWPGNPQPRMFRLPEDGALINRMGLNNEGAAAVAARLAEAPRTVPVFVNVAKTPDPALEGAKAVADYVTAVRQVKAVADVVVLNISCPNSGDGRTFQDPEALAPLLEAAQAELAGARPLLVKLSPDLDLSALGAVVERAEAAGVAGLVATNTTVHREGLRASAETLAAIGRGGLSGAPLRMRSLEVIGQLRGLTRLPIIGVGGISTAAHAREALAAGASLVQLYTGFVYGGPTTPRRIVAGLH